MLWELKLDHNGGDLLRSLTSFPVRMIDQTRTNCRPNKIPARHFGSEIRDSVEQIISKREKARRYISPVSIAIRKMTTDVVLKIDLQWALQFFSGVRSSRWHRT